MLKKDCMLVKSQVESVILISKSKLSPLGVIQSIFQKSFLCVFYYLLLICSTYAIEEKVFNDFASWSTVNISGIKIENGVLSGTTDYPDAKLIIDNDDFDGSKYNFIILRMYNERRDTNGFNFNFDIYWKTESGHFHSDRLARVDILNDGDWSIYRIDLSDNQHWINHTIEKLRIDPQNQSVNKNFAVDYFKIISREINWPLKNNNAIYNTHHFSTVSFPNGEYFEGVTNGHDPYFKISNSSFHADHYNTIEYEVYYDLVKGKKQQLYCFSTPSEYIQYDFLNETKLQGSFHTYSYYLSSHLNWKGNMESIRMDLIPGQATNYTVRVPYVKLAYRLPPPYLLAPENDYSTEYSDTPLLSWAPVSDPHGNIEAEKYEVQVSHDEAFTDIFINEYTTDTTYHCDPLNLTGSGVVYWRVRALDRVVDETNTESFYHSAFSEKRKYTIIDSSYAGAGPAIPDLDFPLDNLVTNMNYPRFQWVDGTNGIGQYNPFGFIPIIDHYEIQIASDIGFNTDLKSDKLYGTCYVHENALSGENYWRVRAVDSEGNVGDWSVVRKITINSITNSYYINQGDSLLVIQNTLDLAAANNPSIVYFQANQIFQFNPTGNECFNLNQYENIIIDGQGSKIEINNPKSSFFKIWKCKNIIIKNISVDYNPVPYTVGSITAVDNNPPESFNLLIKSGYPAPNSSMFNPPPATIRTWGTLVDPIIPGKLKPEAYNHFETPLINGTSLPNEYNLQLAAGYAHKIDSFQVNDVYVRLARTPYPVFLLRNDSENITFDNVTIYSSPATGINSDLCSNIKILNCNILMEEDRYISVNGDGVFIRSNSVGPWIEGCVIEGQRDDGVNIHTARIEVTEVIDQYTIIVEYSNQSLDLNLYDKVLAYDHELGTVNGIIEITNKQMFGNDYELTFNVIEGSVDSSVTKLYNLKRRNEHYSIRNNIFRNNRRFGVLLRAPYGVVEGNNFHGTSASAIRVEDMANGLEGFDASNLQVVNNKIKSCGYEKNNTYEQCSLKISMKRNGHHLSPELNQKNIKILRNLIIDWQVWAFGVCCSENTLIEGNTVSSSYSIFERYGGDGLLLNPQDLDHYFFYIENIDIIKINRNLFMDQRNLTGISLIVDPSTNKEISDNKEPTDFIRD